MSYRPDMVNKMGPAIFDIANRAVDAIIQQISQGDSTVDIHDMSSKATLDVLGSAVLGHNFNSLEGGASDIRQAWKGQGTMHLTSAGFWVR